MPACAPGLDLEGEDHVRRPRVMMIGLDGLESGFAERLMAAGEMPALAALRRQSLRFALDHGAAQRTGLAWEHVASGLSPEAGRRWGAVEFDPSSYTAWQEGARFTPWWAGLRRSVVVFDTPYVDLRRAPTTRGIVGWGVHDPGILPAAFPTDLLIEFEQRFGPYPARRWLYGTPWASPARTETMGTALTRALDVRTLAARWLARERLRDWELFMAVTGEAHSAVEGLWHGVDPDHPLHTHPSGPAAAQAMLDVHRAVDRMIAELVETAGDATIVAFAMGGMGPNHSDIQSMVLLPELLHRHVFGAPLLRPPAAWTSAPSAVPMLGEEDDWNQASDAWLPWSSQRQQAVESGASRSVARALPRPLRALLKGARAAISDWRWRGARPGRWDVQWQPAMCYQPHWPSMPAFALPSFYDGRIRINLEGREARGMVPLGRYEAMCGELERLLLECRNPRTGEPAVEAIERGATRDAMALGRSEADLTVVWRGVTAAFEHPQLGLIGPVPLRRTGGHTGRYGLAYLRAAGVVAADGGVRSAFDVVPTLVALLGAKPSARMSGRPLI